MKCHLWGFVFRVWELLAHILVPIWHTIGFLKPTTTTFADATIPHGTTSTCKQDIQYVRCTIAVMVQSWVCLKTNMGTLSLSEMYMTALKNRQKSNNIGSGRKCWVPRKVCFRVKKKASCCWIVSDMHCSIDYDNRSWQTKLVSTCFCGTKVGHDIALVFSQSLAHLFYCWYLLGTQRTPWHCGLVRLAQFWKHGGQKVFSVFQRWQREINK